MDEALRLAATLDQEADEDFRTATWFYDGVTERCRQKRALAVAIRDGAAMQREVAQIEREADAELVGERRRRRMA